MKFNITVLLSLFFISTNLWALTEKCPVSPNFKAYTCSGSVHVTNLTQLAAYKNTLYLKKNLAKHLIIDFDLASTENINISTPCQITLSPNLKIQSDKNICLHGDRGVQLGVNSSLSGSDVRLEAIDEVYLRDFTKTQAKNLELISLGSNLVSKVLVLKNNTINANTITIDSFDRSTIYTNSIINAAISFGMYSKADADSILGTNVKLNSPSVEISSNDDLRIANFVEINAESIIMNAKKCYLNLKNAKMNATTKIGNCFTTSQGAGLFSINKRSGDAPLEVSFDASKILNTQSFSFSFGDGEKLVTPNSKINHIYKKAGVYTATLSYKLIGEKKYKSAGYLQVEVKESVIVKPEAYFKYFLDGTYTELRLGDVKTQFDIKSAYYIIDGYSRIDLTDFYPNTKASVDLKDFNTHTITLNVEDINGNTSSFTHTITSNPDQNQLKAFPNFKATQSNSNTIFFDLTKSFSGKYQEEVGGFHIDYGDSTAADLPNEFVNNYALHTYANPGTYNVKLTAFIDGTDATIEKQITVTNKITPAILPHASFNYYVLDFAGNVSLYDDQSGTANGQIISRTWDLGDGTQSFDKDISHFYSPGVYLVTLTIVDSMGLKSSQTQKITITDPGNSLITHFSCGDSGMTANCTFFALDEFNQINLVKVSWGDNTNVTNPTADQVNWGLYNVSHTYTKEGVKTLKLFVSTTRGETATKTYTTHNMVLPKIIANLNCINSYLNITCYNAVTTVGSYPTSFVFDMGNGDKINSPDGNLNYTYSTIGTYNITLTATNNVGQQSVATKTINIKSPAPTASINCTINNLLLSCNGLGSFDPSSSFLNYQFDYGDGQVENNNYGVVTHSYLKAGLYTIKFKVSNAFDSSEVTTQQMALLPPNILPKVEFTCDSREPNELTCSAMGSSDSDGTLISYTYTSEGQNNLSTTPNEFNLNYSSGGSKDVTLTLVDNDGGISSLTKNFNVLINHPPVADFICITNSPQKINCYSTSVDNDPNDLIVKYEWYFGDNSSDSQMIPSTEHLYTASSTYSVKLKVTDKYGANSEVVQNVTTIENQAPDSRFYCELSGLNNYQCFSKSFDLDGQIVKEEFFIDDVFVGNTTSIQYIFNNGGDHTISHRVTDNLGLSSTSVQNLTINMPKIGFQCSETRPMVFECNSLGVTASDPNDPVSTIYYVFDNADILPGQNVEYEFYSFGNHTITFKSKTVSGIESSFTQNFSINKKYLAPFPEFIEEVQLSRNVYFDASLSEQVGRTVTKYDWEFGDGEKLSTTDPITTHQYQNLGWQDVKLTTTDATGASATSTTSIYVYDPEVLSPGDAGLSTIDGIDSDGDGIRDDVQIWINKNSFESTTAKKAFRELAGVYKNQMANSNDVNTLQSFENLKKEISNCIDSEVIGEHGVTKSVEFELVYLNSNERMLNFAKIKDKLSGYLPSDSNISATDACTKWR